MLTTSASALTTIPVSFLWAPTNTFTWLPSSKVLRRSSTGKCKIVLRGGPSGISFSNLTDASFLSTDSTFPWRLYNSPRKTITRSPAFTKACSLWRNCSLVSASKSTLSLPPFL
eukprot:NODE_786_length_3896_cov_0.394785.p4 type:complete len:114 gc:universal NODE_786_length_3896_cov_0.394785:969-1310(+)